MDLLKAVNLVLRKIGEIPVTSIDEQYPTLTIVLPALEEARIRLLSEGYWFNTYYAHTLQPDVTGRVSLPLNCLKFFPAEERHKFTGVGIADTDTGSVFINEPVTGRLIVDIPFENLVEVMQYAVAYSAAHDTYLSDIGDDDICRKLEQRRDEFLEQVNGDHTVSRKQNSRKRKQQMRWRHSLTT